VKVGPTVGISGILEGWRIFAILCFLFGRREGKAEKFCSVEIRVSVTRGRTGVVRGSQQSLLYTGLESSLCFRLLSGIVLEVVGDIDRVAVWLLWLNFSKQVLTYTARGFGLARGWIVNWT